MEFLKESQMKLVRFSYMKKGEITVFFALLLSVLSLFLSTVIGNARLHTMHYFAKSGMYIALDSCLAEYHQELFRMYDLFYIDTSYKRKIANLNNLRDHIYAYLNNNLTFNNNPYEFIQIRPVDVLFSSFLFASAKEGRPLVRQAVNYEKTYGENIQYQETEWVFDSVPEIYQTDLTIPELFPDAAYHNIDSIRKTDHTEQPLTEQLYEKDIVIEKEEEVFFDQYLMEHCLHFSDESTNHKTDCELEYILFGKETDDENLELIFQDLLSHFGNIRVAEYDLYEFEAMEEDEKEILYEEIRQELLNDIRQFMTNRNECLYGVTYEDYLMHKLGETKLLIKTARFMDVVENNMHVQGDQGFSLNHCVEYVSVSAIFQSQAGYQFEISEEAGYDKRY